MPGWSFLNIDCEGIRESMLRLADELDDLGFSKPYSDMTGQGRIGAAVRDPRSKEDIEVIRDYLKDLGKEVLAEAESWEKEQAKQVLVEAWEAVKGCIQ